MIHAEHVGMREQAAKYNHEAVEAYQRLACWSGPLGTSKSHYDQALTVFRSAGAVKGVYAFEQACIPPPAL